MPERRANFLAAVRVRTRAQRRTPDLTLRELEVALRDAEEAQAELGRHIEWLEARTRRERAGEAAALAAIRDEVDTATDPLG